LRKKTTQPKTVADAKSMRLPQGRDECRRRSRRCRANIDQRLWYEDLRLGSRRWLRRGLFPRLVFNAFLPDETCAEPKEPNIEKLTAEMMIIIAVNLFIYLHLPEDQPIVLNPDPKENEKIRQCNKRS